MKLSNLCHNERGAVLVTGLIFMAILSIMGTAAYLTSSNELLISRNYKTAKKALYAAEAGIHEARGRLRGSNSDANFAGNPGSSTWWSAYILTSSSWTTADDPNYDGNYENYIPTTNHTNATVTDNSLQSDISYWVKIKYKTEYDAEQAGHTTTSTHYYDDDVSTATNTAAAPGNIIYWGYGNPATPTTRVQFTTSDATEHEPVKVITAYGSSANSSRTIEVEVVNNPGPLISAALYARDNITGNGSAMTIDGTDNCGSAAAKPPIYTLDPAGTTLNGNPSLLKDGNPADPQIGTNDVNISSYVNSLKGLADETITSDQNGETYGDAPAFPICYSNTSDPANVNGLKLQNVTGYGILLVEGDLTLGGGFNWNGIILVTGTLSFNGGGSGVNILGAVLANQTVDINGGVNIKYDSCMVKNSLNDQGIDTISWKID